MKPHVVGSACHRLSLVLEEAMATGTLQVPPELALHAERCGRCGPELKQLERLLARLRQGAASIDLRPVPPVVDAVIGQTGPAVPAAVPVTPVPEKSAERRAHLVWVLSQVAVAAAVLGMTIGGLTYAALKVNQLVTGTSPSQVVQKLAFPFQDWTWARIRSTR